MSARSRIGRMDRIRRGRMLSLVIAVAILFGAPAWAGPEEEESLLASRNAQKTMTYLALSALNDLAFGAALTGQLAVAGALMVSSALTEPIAYYFHEQTWDERARLEDGASTDLSSRTATYGVLNAARIFVLTMIITGSVAFAAAFVGLELVGDSLAYSLNDLAWAYFAPP